MKDLLYIVSLILCVIAGCFIGNWFGDSRVSRSETNVSYQIDSTKHIYNSYETKNYPKETSVVNNILPSKVDTVFVLNDYYATHTFTQTIADSNGRAVINDTISQNRFTGRSFTYQNLRPVQIVKPLRRSLSVGVQAYTNVSYKVVSISPSLLYQDKKGNGFIAGYNIIDGSFGGGYFRKIKLTYQ